MYNLITTIANLPTLVGCKEFPNDQQGMQLMKLIQDFINEEYKYDANTINEAFRMAAKQELYLDGKRIDPSTFGQFLSVSVVGKILTAYKEMKRAERAAPKRSQFLLNEAANKTTPKEIYELCVKKSKLDEPQLHWLPLGMAYSYMVEQGMIKPVEKKKAYIPTKWLNQRHNLESNTQVLSVIEHFKDIRKERPRHCIVWNKTD